MSDDPDLHEELAFISHCTPDRDVVAVLIFCFHHFEYGEDRRGNNEKGSIDKVTSRTYSLSNAKRQ